MMTGIASLVEKAVAQFGTEAKLAAAAGVVQSTVHKAKASGRVGIRLAKGIDAATSGAISKSDLRPDIWAPADPKS